MPASRGGAWDRAGRRRCRSWLTMLKPPSTSWPADAPVRWGRYDGYRASGAEPKATLNRSHQITTLVSPARLASAGMA
jgi:hypothetical protein